MARLRVRVLRKGEKEFLEGLAKGGGKAAYRARIVLLSSQGRSAREIAVMIGLKLDHVRAWIHRFNVKGIDGLKDRGMARSLTRDEEEALEAMREAGGSTAVRAKIILLSSEWYTPREIARSVGVNELTVRGWIYRFNAQGVGGLRERRGMAARHRGR